MRLMLKRFWDPFARASKMLNGSVRVGDRPNFPRKFTWRLCWTFDSTLGIRAPNCVRTCASAAATRSLYNCTSGLLSTAAAKAPRRLRAKGGSGDGFSGIVVLPAIPLAELADCANRTNARAQHHRPILTLSYIRIGER